MFGIFPFRRRSKKRRMLVLILKCCFLLSYLLKQSSLDISKQLTGDFLLKNTSKTSWFLLWTFFFSKFFQKYFMSMNKLDHLPLSSKCKPVKKSIWKNKPSHFFSNFSVSLFGGPQNTKVVSRYFFPKIDFLFL